MESEIYQVPKPVWDVVPMHEKAIVPSKAIGNSGYDVYSVQEEDVFLLPNEKTQFDTGLSMRITPEWGIFFWEKGGFGDKNLSLRAGLTDSNFRGQLWIMLTNLNNFPVIFTRDPKKYEQFNWKDKVIIYDLNKSITQIVLLHTPHVEPNVTTFDKLDKTDRGAGDKGSTNK